MSNDVTRATASKPTQPIDRLSSPPSPPKAQRPGFNRAHTSPHFTTPAYRKKMFPVESLPAAYLEERSAADKERFAKLQQEAMQRAQDQQKRVQQMQAQQQQRIPTPQNITQQYLQRPPLSRPNSGVIGNIFQGFVKAASATPSPCQSTCTTPTPGQAKQISTAELERLVAEQKRDADICAMPVW